MTLRTPNLFLPLWLALSLGTAGAQSKQEVERLQKRLATLEARLAALEKKPRTGSASGMGASAVNPVAMDIMAKTAWRDLRWTDEGQWKQIRHGMTSNEVVALLGSPPRSVKSMKPKIDLVYFYEASLLDRQSMVKGRVSFKDNAVVDFLAPDFHSVQRFRKKP